MYNIYITIARVCGCFVRVFEKRASPKPSPKGKGCERANTPVRPYVCVVCRGRPVCLPEFCGCVVRGCVGRTHRFTPTRALCRDTACRVRVALLRL